MKRGWFRVWRKIEDSDILKDPTALQIFIYLMSIVDRETGEKNIGRFWASEALGMNPNTFKSGLERLRDKYKILTTKSTNRFTTIRLTNWAKYQSSGELPPQADTNSSPTGHQLDTTLQEYRSKNISKDISTTWDFYISKSSTKEKLTDGRVTKIKARLKVFTIEEIQTAIEHCFQSKFHTGTNDRGWKANADYVFRSDEIIDSLKNLEPKQQDKQHGFMTPEELKAKGLYW